MSEQPASTDEFDPSSQPSGAAPSNSSAEPSEPSTAEESTSGYGAAAASAPQLPERATPVDAFPADAWVPNGQRTDQPAGRVQWVDEQEPSQQSQTPPGEWDTWTPPATFRPDDGLDRYPAPPYLNQGEPGAQWAGGYGDEQGFDGEGEKPSRSRSLVRELVETGLMALLVFLAVRATFQNYRVHGHSMDPNLQDGEFLLVNRIEYAQINIQKLSNFVPFLSPGNDPKRDVFTSPQRGDVIILEDPRQPNGDRLVKRVIGLPGDKLEIVSGTVYINGRLLHEPYIPMPGDYTSPPIVIPENQFFVMGDNRRNSEDSRYLGLIPRDLILGKAMVAMWPSNKLGFAPNERPALDASVTR